MIGIDGLILTTGTGGFEARLLRGELEVRRLASPSAARCSMACSAASMPSGFKQAQRFVCHRLVDAQRPEGDALARRPVVDSRASRR
jgi:hypothetical protein